ncbi:MAG TPA: VWA domain-containing protein [Gammaproteobacteria bacterium]|nr:VWA domain-containing protein [Gammaproteobacteria bacterium]
MARRDNNVISMSFLDAITCGFGAIILFFMIIVANIDIRHDEELREVSAETDRMEIRVLAGRNNLVQLREALSNEIRDYASIQAMRQELVQEIMRTEAQAEELEQDDESRREAIERLREELEALQAEVERQAAASITPEEAGNRIRSVTGEGNRQYLTGLRMGGQRVLILVDVSTSMLDKTLVNILRRRNQSPEQQMRAPKWLQAVNTVDWLTAQIEPGTQVQIIGFNDQVYSLFEGSQGAWVTVTDGSQLEAAVQNLRISRPNGPTSLHAAFQAARRMDPPPDNIYLLVDGLPTMGDVTPTRAGVSSRQRVDHFLRAVRELPVGVPVNIILFPMEGDPHAAPRYWQLALVTGGSLLAPSEDWP